MAYAGGYAGGYADTLVPPATGADLQGYYPPRPNYPQAVRTTGRARIRLRLTILTWGAEAHQTVRHTLAAAAASEGTGTARAHTTVDSDLRLRHGTATVTTRAELGTHIGDPREDDRFVARCLAALLDDLEQQEP
jgi:hypothetical protein